MLTKMADDNGGADFDAARDSQEAIRNAIDASARANNAADAGAVVTGTDTANAYTDTATANDVAWQIAGAAAVGGFGTNTSFTFNLGTDKVADQVHVRAKEDLIDVIHVWAWNYETSAFQQISDGGSAISGVAYANFGPYTLLSSHQRDSDGEVVLRFTGTGTATNKYVWFDKINISTGGVGVLTASDIAQAVSAHDVSTHSDHNALGFRVSLSLIGEYAVTAADTALSFTCAALPAVTNYYQFQDIRIHDATNDRYADSWIASMTNAGVVTLGRALPFTPDTASELYVMGTNIAMRGTDSAALAATALSNATWTDARAGYIDELAAANLPTDIADIPTVAEFEARTLVAADYFLFGSDTVANVGTVATLTGHTAQTGDSFVRLGAPAGASMSADVAAVKAETATIVTDTNELQTDWADGGRLDLLLDACIILADTIDGTKTVSNVLAEMYAVIVNKTTVADPTADPIVIKHRNNADDATVVEHSVAADGTGRTK
ncbi:MAG TPA: hypothetical protein VMV78_08840, partial [Thiobacillus sp.]|nr:hypothetical protein [Thiobacillus sp.]